MQDWDLTTWFFIGGGAFFVAAIILFLVIDNSVMSDGEAAVLTPEVASHASPAGSIVPPSGESLGKVKVYVDRTLSMRPFTAPSSTPYFDLLEEMDGLLAGDIQFYGFGFPTEDQQQVTRPINPVLLEESERYRFVNNDYGQLFAGLSPTAAHLVISDGVQSDVDGGDRFGGIVSSIGDWIEEGGVFALLAYRAPYRGTYYHESPTTGSVQYDCDDRPFYAFAFLPSASAKQDLVEILESGNVAPEYVLTVGQASADVQVMERQPPPDPTATSGDLSLTSYSAHESAAPDIRNVYSGRPTGEESMSLHLQVRFDSTGPGGGLTPWPSLSREGINRVAQSLELSTRHWRVDTLSTARDRAVIRTVSSPGILNASSEAANRPMHARMTATMRHSPGKRQERIASLLSIGLSTPGANAIVPDRFSTRRDDRPSACSRTLNLQRTMGAVLREHYVVGRALLVTEWRQ